LRHKLAAAAVVVIKMMCATTLFFAFESLGSANTGRSLTLLGATLAMSTNPRVVQ
jgi:hypothetical protein